MLKHAPTISRRILLVRPRPHTKYTRMLDVYIPVNFNNPTRTVYPYACTNPELVPHYPPLARRLL